MTPLFDRIATALKLSPEAIETWRERLRPRAPDGLSARLLLLTVAFTLAVEALIMGPNLAAFHERWLRDRLPAARMAPGGGEGLGGHGVYAGAGALVIGNSGDVGSHEPFRKGAKPDRNHP